MQLLHPIVGNIHSMCVYGCANVIYLGPFVVVTCYCMNIANQGLQKNKNGAKTFKSLTIAEIKITCIGKTMKMLIIWMHF